ncbi:MAG: hypothetical protein LBI53_00370 [Candidatus Peribacteria bacterium]|jgi:nucleoside phosphorylase|nr:hypothetical protein [Candidatus Peribacteria bacterium]
MLQRWQDEEIYVDMESYGIELVAQLFQYPRLILKVPVDKVGVETKDFDIEEALEKLKKNVDYQKLIKGVLEYISQIKE